MIAEVLSTFPPPEHYASVGWLVVTIFGSAGGLYYTLLLVDRFRGKPQKPPNQVLESALRAVEARIAGIENKMDSFLTKDFVHEHSAFQARRLDDLAEQQEKLWTTLHVEDSSIRTEMTRCFQDIERSLGRIEGEMRRITNAD